jgi:hypothetical protein
MMDFFTFVMLVTLVAGLSVSIGFCVLVELCWRAEKNEWWNECVRKVVKP